LQTFNIQDSGGTRLTVAKGIELVKAMLPHGERNRSSVCRAAWPTSPSACSAAARTVIRGSAPTRRLGAAVDLLVAHGGTAILSETPEIYGAEHLLTRRAVRREKWAKNWWSASAGGSTTPPCTKAR
jgi:altronate hydrolase